MEGRISGLVSLTGPSGNVWHAYLTQQDNDVFLDHGWPTFVKDHLIECGDVLIFRYDGELCFSVQVFDISACEKEAAFHSKCSQDPSQLYKSIGQKREREERAASSDKNCEYVLKKVRGDSSELYSEHINKSLGAGLVISNKEGCQLEEVNTTKKCPEESSSHEKCYSPCPISVIPPQSKPCYQSSGKKDNFQSWGFADRNLFFLKLRGSSIFLKLILLVIYSLSNLLVKIGLGNNSNFKPCCEYKFPL